MYKYKYMQLQPMNCKLVWHLPSTRKTPFCTFRKHLLIFQLFIIFLDWTQYFDITLHFARCLLNSPKKYWPLVSFFCFRKFPFQKIKDKSFGRGLCFILLHRLPRKYRYLVDLCCGRQAGGRMKTALTFSSNPPR